MTTSPNKFTRKTWYIVAFVFIFLLVVSGIIAAIYMYNLREKDLNKVRPDYAMTAAALLKAFEDDEPDAVAKYANRIIEVTGAVKAVNPGENNSVNVSLETDSNYMSVICTFRNSGDLPELRAGQVVTVRGECSGYLMDVLMNNCVLVSVKN